MDHGCDSMSAIRIRPAGSTVSFHPYLPTHHFNVEKQHLRSAENAASCQSRMPESSWRWGGCKCGLVHFSTCSLLHFCPSQQPIHLPRPQFPSLYTITVFPFSALTFSHFQVMTLIGPREPDSSSPHPSSSK